MRQEQLLVNARKMLEDSVGARMASQLLSVSVKCFLGLNLQKEGKSASMRKGTIAGFRAV